MGVSVGVEGGGGGAVGVVDGGGRGQMGVAGESEGVVVIVVVGHVNPAGGGLARARAWAAWAAMLAAAAAATERAV